MTEPTSATLGHLHDGPDGPDDCPECLAAIDRAGGTVDDPWTDDDTAELAEAMSEARAHRHNRYTAARLSAAAWRRGRIFATVGGPASWVDAMIASAAAHIGLAPDPADVDAGQKAYELSTIWHAAVGFARARGDQDPRRHAEYIAEHDDFEEREAIRRGDAGRWPLYAAGLAFLADRDAGLVGGISALSRLSAATTERIRTAARPA